MSRLDAEYCLAGSAEPVLSEQGQYSGQVAMLQAQRRLAREVAKPDTVPK